MKSLAISSLLLAAFCSSAAAQKVITVPPGGGFTPSNPGNLQLAIDCASDGDVLLLEPGIHWGRAIDTYSGLFSADVSDMNLVFMAAGPGVTIEGTIWMQGVSAGTQIAFHGIDFVNWTGGAGLSGPQQFSLLIDAGVDDAGSVWVEDCTFSPGASAINSSPAIEVRSSARDLQLTMTRCLVEANGEALYYLGDGDVALYESAFVSVGTFGSTAAELRGDPEVLIYGDYPLAGFEPTVGGSAIANGQDGGAGVEMFSAGGAVLRTVGANVVGGQPGPGGQMGPAFDLTGVTVEDRPGTIYSFSSPGEVVEGSAYTVSATGNTSVPLEFAAIAFGLQHAYNAIPAPGVGVELINGLGTPITAALANGVWSATYTANDVSVPLVLYLQGTHNDTAFETWPVLQINQGSPSMTVIRPVEVCSLADCIAGTCP